MPHTKLSEEFKALEKRVLNALREAIKNSKIESKHEQTNVIKVNVFDYTELAIINHQLTFINTYGYHHGLYSECTLEDLIDILTQL